MHKDVPTLRVPSGQRQQACLWVAGNALRRFGVSGEGRFRPTLWLRCGGCRTCDDHGHGDRISMQNRQNGRRRRGGGNNPRPMGQPMGGQGNASRLEVRVRGNAHQLLEKYKVLARDAHQAGDRVAAEYYLQHADHYFRVLNDSRIRQDEMRARRGAFDQLDDDTDQDDDGLDQGDRDQDMRSDRGDRDRGRDRADMGDRVRDRQDSADRGRGDRTSRPPRQPDEGMVRAERREREPDRPRRDRPERPRADVADAAAPLSDGEAALAAFGGVPAIASSENAPAPKRRGRPRKVVSEVADADAGAVVPASDV